MAGLDPELLTIFESSSSAPNDVIFKNYGTCQVYVVYFFAKAKKLREISCFVGIFLDIHETFLSEHMKEREGRFLMEKDMSKKR